MLDSEIVITVICWKLENPEMKESCHTVAVGSNSASLGENWRTHSQQIHWGWSGGFTLLPFSQETIPPSITQLPGILVLENLFFFLIHAWNGGWHLLGTGRHPTSNLATSTGQCFFDVVYMHLAFINSRCLTDKEVGCPSIIHQPSSHQRVTKSLI